MTARILVVEDSRTQAEALSVLLEQNGYQPQVAPDGETALELVRKGGFDLVISDVTMPGISGYEVCRQIKAVLRRRDLPVLLLTALSDPMDIVQGLEAGADSYVTKPYEPAQLLARVEHILKNRELRRSVPTRLGVNVTFLGSTFTINSEKEQILDLLISTFEDAVIQNRQLRQREEELQAAKRQLSRYAGTLEERLRSILESVPDVLFSVSAEGTRFHYVSPASTAGARVHARAAGRGHAALGRVGASGRRRAGPRGVQAGGRHQADLDLRLPVSPPRRYQPLDQRDPHPRARRPGRRSCGSTAWRATSPSAWRTRSPFASRRSSSAR